MIYTDNNRGSIQFRDRRKQLVDFSGIRIGNITPTNCDGWIEYHDKAHVLFEIKYRDAEVPNGQLLALERAANDFKKVGKSALVIVAEHGVDNPNEDIVAAECIVRKYYYNGQWYPSKKTINLKSLIDYFISQVNKQAQQTAH